MSEARVFSGPVLAKGCRLFSAAWVVFAAGALGHMTAVVPDQPAVARAIEAMKSAPMIEGMPFELTMMDLFTAVWLETGLLMLGLALLNLSVLNRSRTPFATKRTLTLVDLVLLAPLVALFVVYPVIPALIVFGVTGSLLALDLALSRNGIPAPSHAAEPKG